MTEPEFVTVAAYPDPFQAEAAAALLEDSGIPAFLSDNNTISIMPWYTIALGNVRVDVAAADLERAREVLEGQLIALNGQSPATERADYSEQAEAAWEEAEAQAAPQAAAQETPCPRCGSGPAELLPVSPLYGLALVLLPFLKRPVKCGACAFRWGVGR